MRFLKPVVITIFIMLAAASGACHADAIESTDTPPAAVLSGDPAQAILDSFSRQAARLSASLTLPAQPVRIQVEIITRMIAGNLKNPPANNK